MANKKLPRLVLVGVELKALTKLLEYVDTDNERQHYYEDPDNDHVIFQVDTLRGAIARDRKLKQKKKNHGQ